MAYMHKGETMRPNRNVHTVSIMAERNAWEAGSGTGIVVGKGEVATNAHVVRNSEIIVVTDSDGNEYGATVKTIDVDKDVAVLSVPDLTAPAVTWGEPWDKEEYTQVGYRGELQTYTESVLRVEYLRDAPEDVQMDNGKIYATDTVMWCRIESGDPGPGCSGGPLFDDNGDCVGMLFGGGSLFGLPLWAYALTPETVRSVVEAPALV